MLAFGCCFERGPDGPVSMRPLGAAPVTIPTGGDGGGWGAAGGAFGSLLSLGAGLGTQYMQAQVQKKQLGAEKAIGLAAQTTALAIGQADAHAYEVLAKEAAKIALFAGLGLAAVFAAKALAESRSRRKKAA